jgi:AcrR family transcriptional regulator
VKSTPDELDIHPPQQERTHAAWVRILDAGLTILQESGYDGFTIAAICDRASVSPPAIYARVRTKKALFLAVFEHGFRIVQEETEATRTRLTGDSPDEIIRGAIAAIGMTTLAHELFHRPVILRAEADKEVALRTQRARTDTATWFRNLVLQHPAALRDAAPDQIDACFRVIFAALMARIATPSALNIGTAYTDDAFICELQEMAVRCLLRQSKAEQAASKKARKTK